MAQVAQIGHNRSPFDLAVDAVDLIETEAKNWLDGDAIENQDQCDAVSKLVSEARTAKKQVDEARKAEAKPFDDGKAEVQARYKPLLTKLDDVADLGKKLMAPFLAKIEREKREAEAKARAEAERKQQEAEEAFRRANATDLDARQEAERLAEEAKQADIAARVAARDKAKGAGGARAMTTRTTIKPDVTDYTAAMRWIYLNDKPALEAFVDDYATKAFRAKHFNIDGVAQKEEVTVA